MGISLFLLKNLVSVHGVTCVKFEPKI